MFHFRLRRYQGQVSNGVAEWPEWRARPLGCYLSPRETATWVPTVEMPEFPYHQNSASFSRQKATGDLASRSSGKDVRASRICDALRDGQEKLPLQAQKLATRRTQIHRWLNAGEEVVFGESGKNFSEIAKRRSRRQAT